MAGKQKVKMILVLLESLAGTGHKILRIRPKGGDKIEMLYKDPFVDQTVLYKELKKIKTISSWQIELLFQYFVNFLVS